MNNTPLPAAHEGAAAAAALPAHPALMAPGVQRFLAWLDPDPAALQSDPALPDEPGADTEEIATGEDEPPLDGATPGAALLAAMAMPLMPATLPAMMMAMPGAKGLPAQPAADAEALVGVAAAPGAEARASLPAAASVPVLPQDGAVPLPVADAGGALPARAGAPVQAAPVAGDGAPVAASFDAGAVGGAGWGVNPPAAGAAPARAADTVALAGPPAAWRRSLQEALGERLDLQLGKNVEQAMIRLEPPQLGRIDISIRHAAGSLEVHISATHGEVLRQLNTVSDNLRNDLAQRQYTEVSVSVTQAPARAQAGAQFGADAQGRGRQPREQEHTPGMALLDAGAPHPDLLFSLNGRD
ncbi:flagellar hook-length control protein FliK [Massilia niastensis]|uniref:flagellar hook-length control protein FliK n=1 Tax=Massilia niastensis TaxID=544911 RepID=UPI0003826BB7|nr:flagellar hook-length control protein FliK [Massilia niastensis]